MNAHESGPTRRRSLRLSAKKEAQNNAESGKTSDITPTTGPEISKPDTGVSHDDTHIEADFTDDEVDADVRFPSVVRYSPLTVPPQVIDEDLDGDRSVAEKTVNLSVADGEIY